jgi:hypothetical protein
VDYGAKQSVLGSDPVSTLCLLSRKYADHVFVSSDSNSLVTFIVGKEGETAKFTAHKEVVCHHAEALNAAFNSTFVEGQTQTYRLEDTSEAAFKLFIQWVYLQKIVLLQLQDGHVEAEEAVKEDMALAELWVLADRLCMPRFQNVALKAIFDISEKRNTVSTGPFRFIYENTASDSLFRQFSVANCATMSFDGFGKGPDDSPHQMLVDFGMLMLRRESGDEEYELKISDYLVKED